MVLLYAAGWRMIYIPPAADLWMDCHGNMIAASVCYMDCVTIDTCWKAASYELQGAVRHCTFPDCSYGNHSNQHMTAGCTLLSRPLYIVMQLAAECSETKGKWTAGADTMQQLACQAYCHIHEHLSAFPPKDQMHNLICMH